MSNILKTEATQTKILTAQTSTNEAQTIEPVLGEFGACGGAGDVIAYNSMSNILKTEAAQTKLLPAQTKHKQTRLFWRRFALGGGPTSQRSTVFFLDLTLRLSLHLHHTLDRLVVNTPA